MNRWVLVHVLSLFQLSVRLFSAFAPCFPSVLLPVFPAPRWFVLSLVGLLLLNFLNASSVFVARQFSACFSFILLKFDQLILLLGYA